MKILVHKKAFFKEAIEVKNAIISAIYDLYDRINLYQHQGVEFCKIFNDERVKYDKHGDELFTYKCQKSNIQIRILYCYKVVNNVPVFIVVDYVIKKKNNKQYIRSFDRYNECTFNDLIKSSLCVI